VIVADSSYIVEGLLTDRSLLRQDRIVAPDIAVYEAVGAVWKHEQVLNKIKEGKMFLSALTDLIRTGDLLTVEPNERLLLDAYGVAIRHRIHPHDAVFIALAIENGLELKTLDADQRRAYEDEASDSARGRSAMSRTKKQ
jgi:predicted nucleic acid-binding protein